MRCEGQKSVPDEKSHSLLFSLVLQRKQRIFSAKKRECLCAEGGKSPPEVIRSVGDYALGRCRGFASRSSGVSPYALRRTEICTYLKISISSIFACTTAESKNFSAEKA